MAALKSPIVAAVERFAAGLRFPKLVALAAGLFVLDLVIPDVIPFVDELLLGLVTLILASVRKRSRATQV